MSVARSIIGFCDTRTSPERGRSRSSTIKMASVSSVKKAMLIGRLTLAFRPVE